MSRLCYFAIPAVLLPSGATLVLLSLWAASAIGDPWRALDYWLAWFSFGGLAGGAISIGAAIVTGTVTVVDLCNAQQQNK